MKLKLILLGLLPGIAILIVLLLLVSSRMQGIVDKDMDILRNTLLEAHKTELRNSLDIASSLIKPLYDTAPSGDSAQKEQAIALLKQLKYGKDGYFFGYDGNSVRVFSGSDSARIGDSFRDYKDVNGVFLINDLVKQGAGWRWFCHLPLPPFGAGRDGLPKTQLCHLAG